MWFKKLTGFNEDKADLVRQQLSVNDGMLTSLANGKTFQCGRLEVPSLDDLRQQVFALNVTGNKTTVREVVADTQALHLDQGNEHALFQVASQFNLLEMMSPSVTPEAGIDDYEYDLTQGPACAIAAGAGTIYRQYFVPVDGGVGQSAQHQIDCLSGISRALNNEGNVLWTMQNGYALASEEGLHAINQKLQVMSVQQRGELEGLLKIGIQWQTEVTLSATQHLVSQAYCSALPVSYSKHSAELWADFAQLVLDATYEATFCAAILNQQATGNNTLFLTLIGGGAFGNKQKWIINAIRRALKKYAQYGLDVAMVSYKHAKPDLMDAILRVRA
ncbi:MAG: hypothetical protein HN790_17990 [Methylococcales bacterium]|jgi:hypothetical protein|nr:hypothetical protein [Methylococcales bacterium]